MKDPVCGMNVDPASAAGTSQYQGQTVFFCSQGCKAKFDADPGEFSAVPPARPAGPASPMPPAHGHADPREYTCPMHPEVVQDGPGSCPICGMALEPRVTTLDEQNPELDDMDAAASLVARGHRAHPRVHGLGVPARPAAPARAATRRR